MIVVNLDPRETRAVRALRPDCPTGRPAGREGALPRGGGASRLGAGRGGLRVHRRSCRRGTARHRVGIDTLRSYPTGKDSDVFGRRKKSGAAEDAATSARPSRSSTSVDAEDADGADEARAARVNLPPAPRPDGPWDVSEVREPGEGRVDLGGLFVPGVEGMELRVEVAGDAIVAATVVLRRQRRAAAGLRRSQEARASGARCARRSPPASPSRAASSTRSRARWAGSCGPRCRCSCRTARAASRWCASSACDGPRWFLRGVISGQGAVQPQAAGLLEQIFRDTVVVRGEGPMAPARPDRPEAAERRADGARGRPAGGAGGLPLLRRHGPAAARPGDHRGALTAGRAQYVRPGPKGPGEFPGPLRLFFAPR